MWVLSVWVSVSVLSVSVSEPKEELEDDNDDDDDEEEGVGDRGRAPTFPMLSHKNIRSCSGRPVIKEFVVLYCIVL